MKYSTFVMSLLKRRRRKRIAEFVRSLSVEVGVERVGRRGSRLKELRRKVRRRPSGQVVVDGPRLVADLVRWDVPITELYLTPEAAAGGAAAGWIEAAQRTLEVDASVLESVAPTRSSQGVIAVAIEPCWPRWPAERGVALWLEGIQDPGNLGAIIRSAAALEARCVLLSSGCADPFSPAAVRGSAATVFRLPVEREVSVSDITDRVRSRGGEIVAAAPGGAGLHEWKPDRPCVILLGAEGPGLSRAALDSADGLVSIPLSRGVESLNVAVAAGILLEHARAMSVVLE